MRHARFILLVLACEGCFASTQIQDTIYDESQQPANGTCTISWLSYTTAAGKFVPAGQMNYTVVNGAVNLTLNPHTYRVTCTFLSRPEIWVVPVSRTPITLDLVRHTVPSPPANWSHASTHRHGGGDEIAVESPGPFQIPKAQSTGRLADGWLGFRQDHEDAVIRSLRDKAADWVSIKDFGAVGNGVADDTQAFIRARSYLQSRATNMGEDNAPAIKGTIPTLYLPAGRYRITQPGVLCPTDSPLRGWSIRGENTGTQIRLDFPANNNGFACHNDNKFSFGEFADLYVYGVNGWEKGFYFYGGPGGGAPANMRFRNMRLQNLSEGITMDGPGGANAWLTDRHILDHVIFVPAEQAGATGYWVKNNPQSVVHTFVNVEFMALRPNTIGLRFQSGGSLNWHGGSVIVHNNAVGIQIDDDPHTLPNEIGDLNGTFNIYGIKTEVNNPAGRLYRLNAITVLNFYGAHLVTNWDNGGIHGEIRAGKVVFHGGRNWYKHELITDSTKPWALYWFRPTIIFRDVGIRRGFQDQIVFTHTGTNAAARGRAECTGCYPSETPFPSYFDWQADQCLNCTRGYDGASWSTRVAVFRRGVWDGEGLPGSNDTDTTFTLPAGSILKRIVVVKIPGGVTSSGAVIRITSQSGRVLFESPPWSSSTSAVITVPDVDYYTTSTDRVFTITNTVSQRLYGYVLFEYF